MNFLEAIDFSKKKNKNSEDVILVSSLNFYLPKIFINSYFYKKKLKYYISKSFSNQLKLILENIVNVRDKHVCIFLDWEDLVYGSTFRSANKKINNFIFSECKNNISNLINQIKKIANFNNFIYIFPPFVKLNLDYYYKLNNEKITPSFIIWGFFLEKLSKIDSNLIKVLDEKFNFYSYDTQQLFRTNWSLSASDTDNFSHYISSVFSKNNFDKKLIITDLDDTLWRGNVGEIGHANISWELSEETYKHNFYAKMLLNAQENGKLLAVCSKNDLKIAEKALKREDAIIRYNKWSAIQCGWNSKSQMIKNILIKLNLLDDSFIFIDNSEFEISEVKSNFPLATYINFPEENINFDKFYRDFYDNLKFKKLKDNKIRHKSYLAMNILNKAKSKKRLDFFLKKIKMVSTFKIVSDYLEERPLELINKTNQFNLNGNRINRFHWRDYFERNKFVIKCNLKDNLADHGTVIVLTVEKDKDLLILKNLVISCRVFSRNIEDTIIVLLNLIRKKYNCSKILFNYKKTLKNKLVKEWLEKLEVVNNQISLISIKNFRSRFIGKVIIPDIFL